jgi:hypothetical protein
MPQSFEFDTLNELTAAQILSLVRDHLPAWMRACEAADADAIALHEAEFGTTTTELLLFACAIKFAAKKGKNVYVTCGQGNGSPEDIVSSEHFVAVYREQPQSKLTRKAKGTASGKRNRG